MTVTPLVEESEETFKVEIPSGTIEVRRTIRRKRLKVPQPTTEAGIAMREGMVHLTPQPQVEIREGYEITITTNGTPQTLVMDGTVAFELLSVISVMQMRSAQQQGGCIVPQRIGYG